MYMIILTFCHNSVELSSWKIPKWKFIIFKFDNFWIRHIINKKKAHMLKLKKKNIQLDLISNLFFKLNDWDAFLSESYFDTILYNKICLTHISCLKLIMLLTTSNFFDW
jgi:hypothetical protein